MFQDIEAFPQTKARVIADPGRKHRKSPACNAPISVRDMEAPRKDAERLKTALKAHGAAGGFLTAASPGVTAFFFRNEYYRTPEDYVFAIADAMRHEYETIAASGVTLQIDCPDLAMGRHTQFKDLDLAGFRERMELNIEALNRALVNIRPDRSGCICAGATTRVRTTSTCRFRTSLTSCGRRSRMRSNSRRQTRATATSGSCSRRSRCRKAKC